LTNIDFFDILYKEIKGDDNMTNEKSVDILKNFIFKVAEQAYTSNDTFNSVKAGIVEEHLNGKYKVKLDGSDTLVEATLFYSNEQINQNDYVYLIEAFTENNSNFIKYFIFGKVNNVNAEIGKSDWSRFIGADKGSNGYNDSLANITWKAMCADQRILNSANFIESVNQNGYFAIYGDFTCENADANLKEYGLNITLTYEDNSLFVYKFSSQDFIGQPFNMEPAITQKKIFKIAKNIASISIQGFEDGGSATISISNLTIVAGSLYMLDPGIEVKIAAAAGAKEYFVGVGQEQIKLHAEITQNGQSVFSDLINYIWYINDPDKQETDEDYWECLHEPEALTLTDLAGNSITIPSIGSKASNLILYRGTEPTISESESGDNYLCDIDNLIIKSEYSFDKDIEEDEDKEFSIDLLTYNNHSFVNNSNFEAEISKVIVTTKSGDASIDKVYISDLDKICTISPDGHSISVSLLSIESALEDPIKHIKIIFTIKGNKESIFDKKIKCEIAYEGMSIESNAYDLWDYKYETYDLRIDSNITPVIFYPGDDIDNPIELTAVRLGGPEKNGPKHDFKFKWSYTGDSVGKIYKVTKNNSTGKIEDIEIDVNDDIFKEKTIVLYLSQGSYETESKFIGKYVIKDTVKLQCNLFINDEVNSYGYANQEVRVAQDQKTRVETHYQYFIARGEDTVPNTLTLSSAQSQKSIDLPNSASYFRIAQVEDQSTKIIAEEAWTNYFTYERQRDKVIFTYISSDTSVDIEIYYFLFNNAGWQGIIFEKAFRSWFDGNTMQNQVDPRWYGEWNIIDLLKIHNWDWKNKDLACVQRSTYPTESGEWEYEYKHGLINEEALQLILDLDLENYQALYVTNRRVWVEIAEDGRETVGRQEEWAYPQILKAVKGDGNELTQEALDKLNVFNSLTAGGRDQGMFFEDVYMLTKDTLAQGGKEYYKKQYNATDGSFTYIKQESITGNPRELFLYELKKDQVYINAEYIQTGALRVGDPEQGHIFYADIDQQEVEIGGFTVDKEALKSNDYITIKSITCLKNSDIEPINLNNVIALTKENVKETYSGNYITNLSSFALSENSVVKLPINISLLIDSSSSGAEDQAIKLLIVPNTLRRLYRRSLGGLNPKYILFEQGCDISITAGSYPDGNSYNLKGVFLENNVVIKNVGSDPANSGMYYTPYYHMNSGEWNYNITTTSGFALSSNINKNMIDSKDFKVSHEGWITSTGGTIGGFEIGEDYLKSVNNQKANVYPRKRTATQSFDSGMFGEIHTLLISYEDDLFYWNFGGDKTVDINNISLTGINIVTDGGVYSRTNVDKIIDYQLLASTVDWLQEKVFFTIRITVTAENKTQSVQGKVQAFLNFDEWQLDDNGTHLWSGFQFSSNPENKMIDSKYFTVSHNGEVTASQGKIANWVLDSDKLYSDTIDSVTNKSNNGVGMSATNSLSVPSFWAGYNGYGKSPSEFLETEDREYSSWEDATNFFVIPNGKCVAKNVQIIGQVSSSDSDDLLINCMNETRERMFSVSQGGEVYASKITIQGDGSSKLPIITAGDFTLYSSGHLAVGDVQLYSQGTKCYLWSGTHKGGISIGPNTASEDTSTKLTLNFTKDMNAYGYYWTVTATLQAGTAVATKTSYTLYFEWYWKAAGGNNGSWRVAGNGDSTARGSVTITLEPGEASKTVTVCKRNVLVNSAYQGLEMYRSGMNSTGKTYSLITCGGTKGYDPVDSDYNTADDNRFKTKTFSSLDSVTSQMDKGTAVYISDNLFPGTTTSQIGAAGGKEWAQIHGKQIYGKLMDTDTMKASQANFDADPIDSSDRNKKYNIQPVADIYSQLFDKLVPSTFGFVNGTSGRTHLGLIAQEVKESMDEIGLSDKDCAIYCSWLEENGTETCGLRYGELTALNIYEIQKLKKRESELENKVAQLELQIKEIKGEI
jgi:hypothetical protein